MKCTQPVGHAAFASTPTPTPTPSLGLSPSCSPVRIALVTAAPIAASTATAIAVTTAIRMITHWQTWPHRELNQPDMPRGINEEIDPQPVSYTHLTLPTTPYV